MNNLAKFVHFFAISLRNLHQNRVRTASIAVPLTTIISIVAAITFYLEGVEKDAMLAAAQFPDILLQQQVGGRTESILLDRYYDVLGDTPGIKSFVPRVWGHINYRDEGGNPKAFVAMGLDPGFIASGQFLKPVIEEGRGLIAGDKNKTIIGGVLASAMKAGVGDTIEIQSPDLSKEIKLEVVGIFDTDVQIYTADLALMPIETAREILHFYEEFESSDVLVYLDEPAQSSKIAQMISAQVEGAKPLTKDVVYSLTKQSFGQRSGYFHLLWFILLVNILIIAWFSTTNLSLEQSREIGILIALGWDTGDIMFIKGLEILLIGIFSVLTGLLTGITYILLDAPGLKKLIIGWSDIYPDFPIPLYIDWQTVTLIAILGIFPLLTVTLVPVWRMGMVDPVEVIRK